MAESKILKIAKILNHGEADDGAYIGVRVEDVHGRDVVLVLPQEKAAEFALRFRAGAAYAAEKRANPEADPRAPQRAMILAPRAMAVRMREDGQFVLRIEVTPDFAVDAPIPDEALAPMRDTFAKIVTLKREAKRPN